MKPKTDYQQINRQSWNDRVDSHLKSEFYDVEGFLKGQASLKEIELPLLGDVNGKSILHLQCHFGQDTLSLQRMGANCVGVDLSDKAIEAAQNLNEELGLNARFVACDVYEAPKHIDEKFDVVFTSYGTIGWLPDLDRWAEVIAHFLKPGGKLVFVEFHP
ncbi:MAG TPA: class I SAM-dependent methyltransferase, partial [Cryomorphaceae bacterium]|nr:class I SAM-dependent methyltransferase [Cryomorphaceae bacterium]